jgi:hypothetical protein
MSILTLLSIFIFSFYIKRLKKVMTHKKGKFPCPSLYSGKALIEPWKCPLL